MIVISLVVFVLIYYINHKYEEFIKLHSLAIKRINEINEKHLFYDIKEFDIYGEYDNINMFEDILPEDYLIYQLVNISSDVINAIKRTNINKGKFSAYQREIKAISNFGEFDVNKIPKIKFLLKKKEKKLFDKYIKYPTIKFQIDVTLVLKNMAGRRIGYKCATFFSEQIIGFVTRLNNKQGDYYCDREIWNSICKIERGKVTNKMRFAIYNRDGNRCCNCGSRYNLQIDHIYPISKGGKSTYNNLQTLCENCNKEKSNSVNYNTLYAGFPIEGELVDCVPLEFSISEIRNKTSYKEFDCCPKCQGGKLVLKFGKYGKFYGCTNYPKCKFIKKIEKYNH